MLNWTDGSWAQPNSSWPFSSKLCSHLWICFNGNVISHFSAGGIGVLLNLDHIAGLLKQRVPSLDVRGIADSGWFLDNEQYRPVGCNDAHSCAPTIVTRSGIQWVPTGPLSQQDVNKHWLLHLQRFICFIFIRQTMQKTMAIMSIWNRIILMHKCTRKRRLIIFNNHASLVVQTMFWIAMWCSHPNWFYFLWYSCSSMHK